MSSASPLQGGGTESGNHIGPYVLTKEIGKGSFAVVFQAKVRPVHRDEAAAGPSSNPSTKVAIKIVTRRKLTPKLLENLEGEINILRAVRHVNIVELIDCLKNSSHIYLVMQYCRMGDLSNYIRTRKRGPQKALIRQGETMASFTDESYAQYPHPHDGGLNAEVTRSFLAQLAAALQFMRARNIVHRDIKPQNLLLQEPEAELIAAGHPALIPQVKVADFGFARHLEAASLAETLCGSPLYMAPEILRYVKYDAKADLWSVGAVLYEMCVGKPPFRAANHVDLLRRIDKEKDKIKFPDEKSEESLRKEHERKVEEGKTNEDFVRPHSVDDDLKILIRSLLKRHPVERMTFEAFFDSPVIRGSALPGAKDINASASSLTEKLQPVATRVAPGVPVGTPVATRRPSTDAVVRRGSATAAKAEIIPPAPAPLATPSYFKPKYVVGGSNRTATLATTTKQPPKEQGTDTPTTPGQEQPMEAGEASSLEDNVLETPGSSMTHLPSSARPEYDRSTPPTPTATSTGKISRGHNSLTEDEDKGYVIVEKRNVEVNALADEIADPNSTKSSQDQRGPWGALGVVRRPSRLGRIASGLGAVALVGASGSSPIFSTSPTSPRQPISAQRIMQPSPSSSASPRLASPPLNAPFAIPSGARRPSFNRRSSQNTDNNLPRLTSALQAQPMGTLVPSSAPTTLTTTTGGSSNAFTATPIAAITSPSALTRAMSMASIRLFGVPTGMSLRGANIRRSLRLGLGAAGYLSSSPSNALEYAMGGGVADPTEQNLLALIQDYGQKSFVLSEFADAKLSNFYSEGPHQGNHHETNRQASGGSGGGGHGSSSSISSVNAIATARSSQSPMSSSSEMVAAEALVLYVKSLSFLQRGIDAIRDYIEARSVRYANPYQPSAEINDAVQWLRAKFNDGYERANFARSKASEEMPESAQHMDKMIFDKALEIARGAALEELGTNRTANEHSWNANKCLLAYETASSMLLALLDPGEEAMELSEASAGTIEKFVKSIHKRMANLQRSQEPTAAAASTSPTTAIITT